MYIGHVGAALAAKRVRASIGLLALLVATYTPDWVDGGLCLAGFYNPMLSHSVPAVVLFSLVGFALYALKTRNWTAALVVAGVILSHMLLDWVTGYKPTWPGGPMIGLDLYSNPVADFIVEGDRHRGPALCANASAAPTAVDRHVDHARSAARAPIWNRHRSLDDEITAKVLKEDLR